MIDLSCLLSFVTVVDSGSFGAAAERLGLSQSGVSVQVSRLERSVGARLLARSRPFSMPTEAGSRLLPYARELLALEARARVAVDQRSLAIGASGNIAAYLLPDLVRGYTASMPGERIGIEVSTYPNPELIRRVRDRLLDVAITEWMPPDTGLHGVPWRHEPLAVIVPPNHPLAAERTVSFDRLVHEPMIGGEPGSGTATLLREAFGKKAAKLQARCSFGSTEGVKRAVMAGLGVSITLRIAVQTEVAAGMLVCLDLAGVQLMKTLHVVQRQADRDAVPSARFAAFLGQQRLTA
ncbi:MAG: LysR family transcriptional regulator [Betaproteobacteria bacterium]|nr:LysR family transcriptional regulator [Betaproteobacteria bacterium]